MYSVETNTRVRIIVSGIVQGVGFRPFVYNLAAKHTLAGYVRNRNGSAEIELDGTKARVDSFLAELETDAPPLAAIREITTEVIGVKHDQSDQFHILESIDDIGLSLKSVPPDAATCNDCLSELFDRHNRRYRYPFINCTNCGPRFTIISALPYDRANTTMSSFTMCRICENEYKDSDNRRFHAQPNACHDCGPSLSFIVSGLSKPCLYGEEALTYAVSRLREGEIIAVKGLGGFQLLCDASNESVVKLLRQRKRRLIKPFALMLQNVAMVAQYCHSSPADLESLCSSATPIVLLGKKSNCTLPDSLAPNMNTLGVMLPGTPLHHLLITEFGKPLIATSANYSEEPIAIDNSEAVMRLSAIADGFLVHDRDIQSRYDDSVVRCSKGLKMTLRRARGLAPIPILLPFKATGIAFASGAQLKSTFCFIRDDHAYVSQHIGDLGTIETFQNFEQTVNTYERLFDLEPSIIGHDLHPDYLSVAFAQRLALERGLPVFSVQHHHAHIVSCMVEHGLTEPTIGVAFDGLGYGSDGTLWGGEFLLADYKRYERLAYFEPVPMSGGAMAIKQPWRMALSYVFNGEHEAFTKFVDQLRNRYGRATVDMATRQIHASLNAPLTSSCGRLFDAMSALLDVCHMADYEGQAAMQLEAMALSEFDEGNDSQSYPYGKFSGDQMPFVISGRNILLLAYQDYLSGTTKAIVAARFHATIANLIHDICVRVGKLKAINTICLSGGVFQNELLLCLASRLLTRSDFKVFFPQQLPANDGGLSLGQAVIALAQADAITNSKMRG